MKITIQSKLVVLLAGAALSIASAKSYNISIPDQTEIAGKQLKAGEYQVKVKGPVADIIGDDNKTVEVQGTVESAPAKYTQTAVELSKGSDGAFHISAIELGGTTTKLTFSN